MDDVTGDRACAALSDICTERRRNKHLLSNDTSRKFGFIKLADDNKTMSELEQLTYNSIENFVKISKDLRAEIRARIREMFDSNPNPVNDDSNDSGEEASFSSAVVSMPSLGNGSPEFDGFGSSSTVGFSDSASDRSLTPEYTSNFTHLFSPPK